MKGVMIEVRKILVLVTRLVLVVILRMRLVKGGLKVKLRLVLVKGWSLW